MSSELRVPGSESGGRDPELGTRNSQLRVHVALAVAAILFSLNYIISKVAMRAFSPLVFAYLRIVGAALILNLLFRERGAAPLSRDDHRRLIGFAMLGVVIKEFRVASSEFRGERAGLGTRNSELGTRNSVFIAIAATGAVLVIGFEGLGGTRRAAIGDLLIVLNSLSYALYLVLSKPIMARLSARRVIAQMFGAGAVIMLPIAIWPLAREPWSSIGRDAWIGLLVVILGPTVAAYLINAWALARAQSSLVAAYTYLQPVFTVILAAIFLSESIQPSALLAGAMIFTGVYIAGRSKL